MANGLSVKEAMNRFPKGPEYYGIWDDFLGLEAGEGDWIFTAAGSGVVEEANDTIGGACAISGDGATDNSGGTLLIDAEFIGIEQAKEIIFMARFKMTDVDDQDMHFGIFVKDTTIAAGVTDGIYCNVLESEADGGLNLAYERDSTAVSAASGETLVDDTYVVVGCRIVRKTATTGDIMWYYNEDEVPILHSKDVTLPIDTEEKLTFGFESLSGTTTADKLTIDYAGLLARR